MKNTPATAAAPLNIGQAAQRAEVSPKMARHYESLGLLPAVQRSESGYRQYGEQQVHTLRFIKRARDLGFSMPEIAELLKLWQDKRRPSSKVKRIAAVHVADLDQRIAELTAMRRTLQHLVQCCHGDHRPDCPILDELGH
jgi:Cu(I)-responsive transcriptional regulator